VIDPNRQAAQYIDVARKEGLRITRVTETHIHADFVSGTRELAAATGAQILLSGEGGSDWQYRYPAGDQVELLHDGDVITLGGVQLDVIHTPGHTPEHLAFVVTDMARSPEPIGLVSGDFVFVGDVGRPDLLERVAGAANTQEAGAAALFESLQKLAPYPDYMQVWPGHGAGSACGKALGALPASTLGYERRTNWAFRATDQAVFIASVLDGQPEAPTYFAEMKRVNRDGPAIIGQVKLPPVLTALDLPEALRRGVVLDLRPTARFTEAHIPATLNIPMGGAFTKWAGWLLRYDRDLYLIADNSDVVMTALQALAAIGVDRVKGSFDTAVITPDTARRGAVGRMADAAGMHAAGRKIFDVRENNEWAAGHLPFAEHHVLGRLAASVDGLERDTPIALHCQGGTRSAIGASLLGQLGFTDVVNLADGWGAMGK
jgi:hydroxyacylglutathione hydrolase